MKIDLNFIPQNTALKGARSIGLYDSNGNEIKRIPLGNLAPKSKGNILYTFGALSDVHLPYNTGREDFIRVLNYFNNTEKVDFICIAGDMSSEGTAAEWADYKTHVDTYSPNTAVHISAGNHDASPGLTYEYPRQYTGNPLYYSFEQGNDLFIMFGLPGWDASSFTTESLQWLYEILEKNRNKRCFVFQHIMRKNYSGDAAGIYGWDGLNNTKGKVFLSLMEHYKNVLWFHGHSHCEFEHQKTMLKENANYDRLFGCHSIHIPSCAATRNENNVYEYEDSEGYVVDVYDNGVHLRGRDFIAGEFLPIASYWIDTTPTAITANSYTDSTGTINTGSSTPSEPSGEITLPEGSELLINKRYSSSGGGIVDDTGSYVVFIPVENDSTYILNIKNNISTFNGDSIEWHTLYLLDSNKTNATYTNGSNHVGKMTSGLTISNEGYNAEIRLTTSSTTKYIVFSSDVASISITEDDIKDIIITLEKVSNDTIQYPENSEFYLNKRYSGSSSAIKDDGIGMFALIMPVDSSSNYILEIKNSVLTLNSTTLHTLYLLDSSKKKVSNVNGSDNIKGMTSGKTLSNNDHDVSININTTSTTKFIALSVGVNETNTYITEDEIKNIIITLEKELGGDISENRIVNIPGIVYNQRISQSGGGMSSSGATGMFTFALQVDPGTKYCLSFEGLPLPLNQSVSGTSNNVLYGLKTYNPIDTIHALSPTSAMKDMGSDATANSVTFTTSSSTPTNYIIVSIAATQGVSISESDVAHITYKLEKI